MYFAEAPLEAITASILLGYDALQAWHTCIWGVSPIPLCRSSQALSGWMGSVTAQLFSGRCRNVRSVSSPSSGWATQGHSETCPEAVALTVCLGSLSCCKGKSALDQVIIKDHSVLCSFHLCLDPDKSPSSCRWKTSPQHDADTNMLHCKDGARFPPDVTWNSGQKVQSWCHQTRESCFSWSDSPLGAFWQTPSSLSCAFYWEVASVWPLYHKGLIGGVRWLSFWKVLPSPQRDSGALSEWPSGSWSPPWPRAFSPDCSVWPGGQL